MNEPKFKAQMVLPKNGFKLWTAIMQGDAPVPDQINPGSPVVQASAKFEDGTWVTGGVLKGSDPKDYNIKFMWVFDTNGNQYPGWPIDTSDDQDFDQRGYYFSLTDSDEEEYLLEVVERK